MLKPIRYRYFYQKRSPISIYQRYRPAQYNYAFCCCPVTIHILILRVLPCLTNFYMSVTTTPTDIYHRETLQRARPILDMLISPNLGKEYPSPIVADIGGVRQCVSCYKPVKVA